MKNTLKNPFMSRQKNTKNVFCFILIVSLLAFGCEKHNSSDGISDFSSIAFIARITDNSADWSLCTMDKSGNNMQKIVDKVVGCLKPIRSHCGTRLLFTSHSELYIVNIDGTGLTLIDYGSFSGMDWLPNNKHIVYVKYMDSYYDSTALVLYNTLDNTKTILQTEGNVCNPKFSPDGRQIAYCTSIANSHRIYKMDINGQNNRLIISEGASPIWSPQGNKIAYLSTGVDRSSQISVANADGSNQKQLTSTVSSGWWDTGFPRDGNEDPQWTPNGEKIVYVSYENGKPEIFIMNADGSQQTRLTKAEYRDECPEVTPDGKYILYSSRRSDMMNNGIVMMTLDGKNEKILSKTGIHPIACK